MQTLCTRLDGPWTSSNRGFVTHRLGAREPERYHKVPVRLRPAGGRPTVNQAELRLMTEERIKDAQSLIDGKRWEFGYYAAGYAVECALKSCLLSRMIHTGWVFDEEVRKVEDCRTHEFLKLIQIAGLREELNDALKASAAAGGEFVSNWDTVNLWKVTSRYEPKSEADAKKLLSAIIDDPHGVLKWIRNYW
jgi:hypothetical protein